MTTSASVLVPTTSRRSERVTRSICASAWPMPGRERREERERIRDAPDHVVVDDRPLGVAGLHLLRLGVEVEEAAVEGQHVRDERDAQREARFGLHRDGRAEEQYDLLFTLARDHDGTDADLAGPDQRREDRRDDASKPRSRRLLCGDAVLRRRLVACARRAAGTASRRCPAPRSRCAPPAAPPPWSRGRAACAPLRAPSGTRSRCARKRDASPVASAMLASR